MTGKLTSELDSELSKLLDFSGMQYPLVDHSRTDLQLVFSQ